MNTTGIWKKLKRILALTLAITIAVNGWQNYGISAKANISDREDALIRETEERAREEEEQARMAEERALQESVYGSGENESDTSRLTGEAATTENTPAVAAADNITADNTTDNNTSDNDTLIMSQSEEDTLVVGENDGSQDTSKTFNVSVTYQGNSEFTLSSSKTSLDFSNDLTITVKSGETTVTNSTEDIYYSVSWTKDGSAVSSTSSINEGGVYTCNVKGSGTYDNYTGAGTFTVYKSGTLTIIPSSEGFTESNTTASGYTGCYSATYKGAAYTPNFSVSDGANTAEDNALTQGTDYKISYSSDGGSNYSDVPDSGIANAGTYIYKVEGLKNNSKYVDYSGSTASYEFKINKLILGENNSNLSVALFDSSNNELSANNGTITATYSSGTWPTPELGINDTYVAAESGLKFTWKKYSDGSWKELTEDELSAGPQGGNTYQVVATAADNSTNFINTTNDTETFPTSDFYTVKKAVITSVELSVSDTFMSSWTEDNGSYTTTFNGADLTLSKITVTGSTDDTDNITSAGNFSCLWYLADESGNKTDKELDSDKTLTPGKNYILEVTTLNEANYTVETSLTATLVYKKATITADQSDESGAIVSLTRSGSSTLEQNNTNKKSYTETYFPGIILPTISIKYGTNPDLTRGTHYTLSWKDPQGKEIKEEDENAAIGAGTYTATIKAEDDSNYTTGNTDLEITYQVNPKSINGDEISITFNPASGSNTYTGSETFETITNGVTVSDNSNGNTPLKKDDDYTIKWYEIDKDENKTEKNMSEYLSADKEYTLEITGEGNYDSETGKTATYSLNYGNNSDIDNNVRLPSSLTKNIYNNSFDVKVDNGYTIALSEADLSKTDEKSSVTVGVSNISDSGSVTVYVQNSSNKIIYKYEITGLSIDTTAPALSNIEISNDGEWSKSKTITVTCSNEDLYTGNGDGTVTGLYYATENKKLEKISDSSKLDDLTPIAKDGDNKYTFKVNDDIGVLTSENYWIYAVDKAGNVTKVGIIVDKIDTEAPATTSVSSKPGSKDPDFANNHVIWKNTTGSIDVTLAFEDQGTVESGFITGAVTVDTTEGIEPGETSLSADASTSGTATFTVTKAGTYKVTVEDQAGNESSYTFVVKQDTTKPTVAIEYSSLQNLDSGSNTVTSPEVYHEGTDTTGTYWTGTTNIRIPLTLADSLGSADSDVAGYKLEISTNADMSNATELQNKPDIATASRTGISYNEDLTGLTETPVTYYFRVTDYAGNASDIVKITVAGDKTAPTITSVTFPQNANSDEWLNASELGSDTVKLDVKLADTGSAVKYITVSHDGGNTTTNYEISKLTQVEGAYRIDTGLKSDGTADNTYSWTVTATDFAQNVSTVSSPTTQGNVDVTRPEQTVYIKFISDATDADDNSQLGSILDAAKQAWNKIWGKSKVNIEVYVKDNMSGIDSITVNYTKDGKTTDAGLTRVDGVKAFTAADGTEGTGYVLYEGSIEASGEISIKNFTVSQITDVAGNQWTDDDTIVLKPVDKDLIFLDAVAPILTEVSVDGNSVAQVRDPYYFTSAKTVKLSIDERFFDEAREDGNVPVVKLSSRTSTTETWTESTLSLEWTRESGTIWTTSFELANVEGQETEYKFTVSYTDSSTNQMVSGDGIVACIDGTYTSKTFIVDAVAPVLTSYSINAANTWEDADGSAQQYAFGTNGAVAYLNDTEQDDIRVTFALNENSTYISDDRVQYSVSVYERNEEGGADTLIASTDTNAGAAQELEVTREGELSSENRAFTYSFGFDGKTENESTDNVENIYYIVISYTDAAGNKMISGTNSLTVTDGVYTSPDYLIDHVAPVFGITFNDAYQVLNNSTGLTTGGTKPQEGMVSYYGSAQGQVTATITLTEKYVYWTGDALKSSIADFEFLVNGTDKQTDITWTQNGTTYTGTYVIKEEGNYTITVNYSDSADNLATQGSTEGGDVTDGSYTSPTLVLDTTKPVLTAAYTTEPVNTYNDRKYFNADTYLVITVTDYNIRYQELKNTLSQMTATDINGTAITDTKAKEFIDGIEASHIEVREKSQQAETWTATIPLSTEANYTIPITYTDIAGNTAELNVTEQATVDKTNPTELVMSYSVNDPVNYGLFGWLFSQTKMTITASTTDATAGLQYIIFTVTDENGKETVKTQEVDPAANGSFTVEIPIDGSDFKGTVKAEAIDYSTNQTELTRNHAVESSDRHSSTGSAVITTNTSPSRIVDGVKYYNSNVNLTIDIQDKYSGIRSYAYVAGSSESFSRDFAAEAGTDLTNTNRPDVTYSVKDDVTLEAGKNNANDVLVTANFMDNTQRTGSIEQTYNIDVTAPEITVTYDLNDPSNEVYYNQTRTATVQIRERNFSADDVTFTITNTDGVMPTISGWTTSGSGDDMLHTCTVTFSEDGDYTFTVSFMDLAGNKAVYDRVDEFTIDRTNPEMTVSWDNTNSLNEYYYDADRTATIDILEHNFDASLVNVQVQASGDAESTPTVSGWTKSGDHNIATVSFPTDGDYTIAITGMDLAENEMNELAQEHFVVDMTAPELEIYDIEDMSANNGTVRPGIRYSDTNYDEDATSVVMKGYKNGVIALDGTSTVTATGVELKMNNFAETQDMDDMYTMNATVYDKAGNSTEASVTFSVNRFGSVYTFDDATEELVGENGKYYTNEEQDIVVTETNVDTLEFEELTLTLNGDLVTLVEGEDYTVEESGSEVTWKQYVYTIPAENFTEEGSYIITIESHDRATNEQWNNNNKTEEKEIRFVVDKTSPSVLVSGVENDGQYRENSRDITLDAEDNVLLSELTVNIDGTVTTYDAEQINEANGRLVLSAGSANHWQTMTVTATDAAGNTMSTESMRFLITSNLFIQFINNRPLLFGSIAGLVIISGAAWWFLFGAKRRKDDDENKSAAA